MLQKIVTAWKQDTGVVGNRFLKKTTQLAVEHRVQEELTEKTKEVDFLEEIVRELQERYKMEIRKKNILKNQCDQAYLKGVSSLSMEALKLSQSTLNDMYSGIKMPQYDGSNILNQITTMNESLRVKSTSTTHTTKTTTTYHQHMKA